MLVRGNGRVKVLTCYPYILFLLCMMFLFRLMTNLTIFNIQRATLYRLLRNEKNPTLH
jgi:preprotein translocase subunit SecY